MNPLLDRPTLMPEEPFFHLPHTARFPARRFRMGRPYGIVFMRISCLQFPFHLSVTPPALSSIRQLSCLWIQSIPSSNPLPIFPFPFNRGDRRNRPSPGAECSAKNKPSGILLVTRRMGRCQCAITPVRHFTISSTPRNNHFQ